MTETRRLRALHRYTITSEGASKGYFRLVEDADGAWVTWAEIEALLSEPQAAQDWTPFAPAPTDRSTTNSGDVGGCAEETR